jgi:predicted RNA-binding protein (virulence factor B family)
MVKIYIDKASKRIAASAKIDSFLDNLPPDYQEGQEVDLMICDETELGYKAIVNNMHWGMLYKNEVFQQLEKGWKIKGYIKKIREDEKIDLSLFKPGYGKVDAISEKILKYLGNNKGYMAITDKSSPELIYSLFGISKKAYKMAIGGLYKKGLVILESEGVKLKEQRD